MIPIIAGPRNGEQAKGVVMDLADPIPVIVARPLALRVTHGSVTTPQFRQPCIPTPLVAVDQRPRPGHPAHELLERLLVRMLHHTEPHPATLASDHGSHRRPVARP